MKPAAMANNDEAGARAAAEYFIELYGYSVQSQDLAAFSAMCDPASVFCSGVASDITADMTVATRTEGGASKLRAHRVDAPGADDFYTVWGQVDRQPFVAHSADGTVVYESDGQNDLDFAIAVEYIPDAGWLVRAAKSGVVPTS